MSITRVPTVGNPLPFQAFCGESGKWHDVCLWHVAGDTPFRSIRPGNLKTLEAPMTAARNDFLLEEHGPLYPRSAAARLDTPASEGAWSDLPWSERDASATAQQLQTAVWIEEILADLDPEC